MPILLTAATAAELSLLPALPAGVDTLVTGVGVPASLFALQQQLYNKNYRLVIQAGIAGSFNPALSGGAVVLVKKDVFADIGMEENGVFTSIYQTAFTDGNTFPYEDGWLPNHHPLLQQNLYPLVNAVTINKVSNSALQTAQLSSTFGAAIETMEGAALHYTCRMLKVPFLQIRSISNAVGVRDKTKWTIGPAIANLNKAVAALINQLTS
ncbi:MAG: futalosine hydrolase [Bacteroidota bacterium]